MYDVSDTLRKVENLASSMDSFQSFVDCTATATRRLGVDRHASQASSGTPCYTQEKDALLLCDSCLAFWKECVRNADQSSWFLAAYLRAPGAPYKVVKDLAPAPSISRL